ncbi:hypothetical protein AB0K09_24000 [Streptomyces sp. NPDC049577]|uniref:hypothetical protein n=1 Tax=Streptomyces sp. NPDC049577 TaxID=3155153 RepID=UPI003445BDEC
MIKNERLRRGLVVAGTMAAAVGGSIGGAQAAELPELGTPVAASGLTSGLDSVSEASPILVTGGLANSKQTIGGKVVDTLRDSILEKVRILD